MNRTGKLYPFFSSTASASGLSTTLVGNNISYHLSHNTTSLLASIVNENDEKPFPSIFWKFSDTYRPIHGWLSTAVCLFGIPSNLLNIIVLTRPNMITSPTNLILTGLAFSDLFTMLSSLVFGIYFYIVHPHESPERDTWAWTHFAMSHVMASVTFHSISIWLTVYLACFRYIYLASSSSAVCGAVHPSSKPNNRTRSSLSTTTSSRIRSMGRCIGYFFHRCLLQCRTYNFTLLGILGICIFCILFCVPAYLYPSVYPHTHLSNTNTTRNNTTNFTTSENSPVTFYKVDQSEWDKNSNGYIFKLTFYTQAILGKFIPCILLVTFSSLLIHSLVVINRKNKLLNKSSSAANKSRKPPKPTFFQRLTGRFHRNKSHHHHHNHANSNSNAKSGSGGSEPLKKSVSLQVPEKLDNSSIVTKTTSTIPASTSAFSLPRRLSDIRLPKKMFSRNNCQTAIELEDDDVPIKLPPKPGSAKSKQHAMQNGQKSKTHANKKPPVPNTTMVKPKRNKTKENLRTTLMLIIVCILFLITEFPQAILILFSIIYGDPNKPNSFYNSVYMALGDLLDMLALINNSINFLLYCTMSRAFRNTFYTLIVNWRVCALLFGRCLPKETQAQARTKRQQQQGQRNSNNTNNKNNSNDLNNANNLNMMINSANFSIFTGNTAFNNNNNNGANLSSSMNLGGGKDVAVASDKNEIELKPLIGKDGTNKC